MDFLAPAQLVGYIAFVLGITGFLQKSDLKLKLFIAAESAAYTLHFLLLDNHVASASAAVNSVRLLASAQSASPYLAALFIAINLAVGVFTAITVLGWLLVIFNCIATYAAFCLRGIPMRLCFLASTLIWLINNYVSGSIGGTVLECCIAIANAVTIAMMIKAHKKRLGDAGAPATSGAHAFALMLRAKLKALLGR